MSTLVAFTPSRTPTDFRVSFCPNSASQTKRNSLRLWILNSQQTKIRYSVFPTTPRSFLVTVLGIVPHISHQKLCQGTHNAHGRQPFRPFSSLPPPLPSSSHPFLPPSKSKPGHDYKRPKEIVTTPKSVVLPYCQFLHFRSAGSRNRTDHLLLFPFSPSPPSSLSPKKKHVWG